jgi:hypothetical protein
VQRGSDRHNSQLDDEMKQETAGVRTGTGQTRAEEAREAEPSGEGQPDVERAPEGPMGGADAEGMGAAEVEHRSELARWLDPSHFPAVREVLIGDAIDNEAPDDIVDQLKSLPSGREYANVEQVWATITRAE